MRTADINDRVMTIHVQNQYHLHHCVYHEYCIMNCVINAMVLRIQSCCALIPMIKTIQTTQTIQMVQGDGGHVPSALFSLASAALSFALKAATTLDKEIR